MVDKVSNDEIFEWLVKYHIDKNLPLYSRDMLEGRARYIEDEDIGYDYAAHNKSKRFLIVANGDSLVDKLNELGVVQDKVKPAFIDVQNYDAFSQYFNRHRGDGAFVFNKKRKAVGRVHEYTNNIPVKDVDDPVQMIPLEVLSYNSSVSTDEFGCKTRLAAKLPFAQFSGGDHHIETYQIKGTIHSPIGAGVVTHFTKDYMELFFFRYDPQNTGEFIDKEHSITGVYRFYKREGNRYVQDKEKIISKNEHGELCSLQPITNFYK